VGLPCTAPETPTARARDLRKCKTYAGKKFWQAVRGARWTGSASAGNTPRIRPDK